MGQFIRIKNNQRIEFNSIPILPYIDFRDQNSSLPSDERYHCVSYFAHPEKQRGFIRLICCIADDMNNDVLVSSCTINPSVAPLPSFTAVHESFHMFEREIYENYGLAYTDHPWLKPVRYACNRADRGMQISNYPFAHIEGEELHEVGVGPVHAGIIEPGYFRFTCNGEKILYMEIQMGYQHRGVEQLFVEQTRLNQRISLSENIAGDTVVGHNSAFALIWETLCGYQTIYDLLWVQTIALELERIAIHTGDLAALCGDVGYQLGSSVYGRLRTPIVNFFQSWCGNRLARTLIRPGCLLYPFTDNLAIQLTRILIEFERDFYKMGDCLFNMPGILSRFEKTGTFTAELALRTGAVGMTARASNIGRDIRKSHPDDIYRLLDHQPVILASGDVLARARLRHEEVVQSIRHIRNLLHSMPHPEEIEHTLNPPASGSFALSMVEGWRGEICHCAITGENGGMVQYKIVDPSFHNWTALALAVRNNEISDFPVCNKSFNLSYCGFDL